MKKFYIPLIIVLLLTFSVFSQNPFAEFGYNPPIATSSKGEFQEFHDLSNIVEIGSIKFNTITKEIVGFVEEEKSNSEVSAVTIAMSVDPHCERYYWISPYAYCFNNPVRFVDPDGRDPRIYVERKGFGHAFVTTGAGDNTTVYTYGRYAELGKDKSVARSTTPIGEGVLIKLTGDDAKSYIQNQLLDNEAKVYEFTGGSDELVSKHFDDLLDSSDKTPTTGKYKENENARVVDEYNLFNNNCVTVSTEGVQKGVDGNIDIKDSKAPASVGDRLEVKSQKNENGVRKVSYEEIKKELNLRGVKSSW